MAEYFNPFHALLGMAFLALAGILVDHGCSFPQDMCFILGGRLWIPSMAIHTGHWRFVQAEIFAGVTQVIEIIVALDAVAVVRCRLGGVGVGIDGDGQC